MNRTERQSAHAVQGVWMPDPESHLRSVRDAYHYYWTLQEIGYDDQLAYRNQESILDVGAWDGWLDFLLLEKGYTVEGVELVPELCESAAAYAKAKGIQYRSHCGFFEDVEITKRFDVVLCFETLEHIPWEMVPAYVEKMESIATEQILISLPDQRRQDNPQHLWTPTFGLIRSMWGRKPDFELTYKPYHGTDIPPNFLCSWSVK